MRCSIQVARHAIEAPTIGANLPHHAMSIPDLSTLADSLPPPIVHDRVTDGADQTWRRDGEVIATRRLDAAGRVIAMRTADDSVETFAYGPDGELAGYSNGNGTDEGTFVRLGYEHDGAGRLTARAWSYGSGVGGDRDEFRYTCR